VMFNGMFVSGDGKAYACSYHQLSAELFVAEGLK
jgi:hypothetical protein